MSLAMQHDTTSERMHTMQQGGSDSGDSPTAKASSLHDSARGSPDPEDLLATSGSFERLVEDINTILGPSSGIDSEDVDVEEIVRVMQEYVSVESEWQRYAFADLSRPYTRNLVDAGNGKCNLVSHFPVSPVIVVLT